MEAEPQWRAAAAEQDFVPSWQALGNLHLQQQRWPEVEQVAARLEEGSGEKKGSGTDKYVLYRFLAVFQPAYAPEKVVASVADLADFLEESGRQPLWQIHEPWPPADVVSAAPRSHLLHFLLDFPERA